MLSSIFRHACTLTSSANSRTMLGLELWETDKTGRSSSRLARNGTSILLRQSTKVFIIHHMIFEPRPLSLQQQHTKNFNDKSRWMSSWCYCYCLNLNQIVQSHQGSLVNTSLHCSGLTGKALHRYSEKLQDKLDYFLDALAVRHCP